MNAIIIGGGIGGLTAAIALRLAGIEATVYERAPELREVGAGISVWGNALRALARIGADSGVVERGEKALYAAIRSWRGRVLTDFEMGAVGQGMEVPVVTMIHRAELLEALLERLPPGAVRSGAQCVGVEQDGRSAGAVFADGTLARADLLIGADGINSTVRAAVLNDGPPRYSGYTCWRGVVPFPENAFPAGHVYEYWGRGARFGLTRIGRGRAYWWATHNRPAGGTDTDPRADLLRLFTGWADPVEAVVRATDTVAILRNDIVDRPPFRDWGKGRITLLGDAAHPTTPNLGQGGCMAIEDGVVLAGWLKDAPDIPAALRLFERARYPRTAMITRDSWWLGAIGQWESGALRAVRDMAIRMMPRRQVLSRTRGLLRFEG